MVSGVQSFHDIRLYSLCCCLLAAPGIERAIYDDETRNRMSPDGAGLSRHGSSGLERRCRQSELGLAAGLFRRYYDWRALPFTDKSVVGHQDCTGAASFDDDGRLAGDQFRRKFPGGVSRQLMVE